MSFSTGIDSRHNLFYFFHFEDIFSLEKNIVIINEAPSIRVIFFFHETTAVYSSWALFTLLLELRWVINTTRRSEVSIFN